MALQKTPINIPFNLGIDTKTDPFQVRLGNFTSLVNSVFDTTGRLTKRNGFPIITTLPNTLQTNLTTLNDNLLATGSNLYTFAAESDIWINQGNIQPVKLSVLPIIRNNNTQSSPDIAVASNGLAVAVYFDGSIANYKVFDSTTGQLIFTASLGTAARSPRAFSLGNFLIVTFITTISAVVHLQYIAIPTSDPTHPHAAVDIATSLTADTDPYDGFMANNNICIAYKSSGTQIKLTRLDAFLNLFAPTTIASGLVTNISITADTSPTLTSPIVWVTYYNSGTATTTAYNFLTNVPVLAPTTLYSGTTTNQLTTIAANGILTTYAEVANTYAYAPNAVTDYLNKVTCTQTGTVGAFTTFLRSVGLASKPFSQNNTNYMLVAYGDTAQTGTSATNEPTYFLIDDSGNVIMKLANNNGGGYTTTGFVLPGVALYNDSFYVAYLDADAIVAVNKGTGLTAGTPVNQILSTHGVNMAVFSINDSNQYSSEIAGSLHLTGGILWQYDAVKPVEQGFNLYPENIAVTTATGSGAITANTYFYQFCYEWTDNAGNLHRSAPSIPVSIVTTTSSSTNTINVPTLRLTYKTGGNVVRIVGYRWSTSQQVYYQFTSYSSPVLNDTTIDSVTIVDTSADTSILGNTILYTTGGVVENIGAPSFVHTTLSGTRLFGIDSEDQNLLWYSKQVIENTPVEMSDLFTIYVPPTTGTQGSTGPMTALAAMDDKLIIFKKSGIYYLTGNGPDNTGNNSDFSNVIYIISSVGTTNPNSIVLTPDGLMFQSDHGIWLLGRNLDTIYIGAPTEGFNGQLVTSANRIPGTNQVRFILNNSSMLMYDYYQKQWGTFTSQNAISATLWQDKHTYLSSLGTVYQETPNTYLDGTNPVLMSFTTSWINLAGIQGFQRFYHMFLLGTYLTPFKLSVSFSFDHSPSLSQLTTVTPENAKSDFWGGEAVWGSGETGPWGGPTSIITAQVFPSIQKCETVQVSVQEIYDPSFGIAPGAGLTLSGLNCVIGAKKGYKTVKATRQFG